MAALSAQQAGSSPPPRVHPSPARPPCLEHRRIALMCTPAVVPATQYGLFQGLSRAFVPRLGYFAAFAVYWIGWCVLFPLWVVGWRSPAR